MGVALTLDVRAAHQGPSTCSDQAWTAVRECVLFIGTQFSNLYITSHLSASTCLKDRVHEAVKWLQAAFDGGRQFAKLHLAHLTLMRAKRGATRT